MEESTEYGREVAYIAVPPYKSALETEIGGNHYRQFSIQPIEFIQKNKLDFLQGCIIKYICRFRQKNGQEDLLKAKHYIDLLLELEYGCQPL
jgi:hypothetical protein